MTEPHTFGIRITAVKLGTGAQRKSPGCPGRKSDIDEETLPVFYFWGVACKKDVALAPVKMKSALVGSFYQEKAKKSEAEGKKLKTLLITKKTGYKFESGGVEPIQRDSEKGSDITHEGRNGKSQPSLKLMIIPG